MCQGWKCATGVPTAQTARTSASARPWRHACCAVTGQQSASARNTSATANLTAGTVQTREAAVSHAPEWDRTERQETFVELGGCTNRRVFVSLQPPTVQPTPGQWLRSR